MPYRLTRRQIVQRPVADVFEFLTRPGSFERQFPPWMGCREARREGAMQEGSRIECSFRAFGLAIRWALSVTEWNPPHRWTLTQIHGPFKRWRHTLTLTSSDGRTALSDDIDCEIPGGVLGRWISRALITRKIRRVLNHRSNAIGHQFARPRPCP